MWTLFNPSNCISKDNLIKEEHNHSLNSLQCSKCGIYFAIHFANDEISFYYYLQDPITCEEQIIKDIIE